jgi:hypothetical protein
MGSILIRSGNPPRVGDFLRNQVEIGNSKNDLGSVFTCKLVR